MKVALSETLIVNTRAQLPPEYKTLPDLINPPLVLSAAAESLAGAYLAGAALDGFRPYLAACAGALFFAAGSIFGHYFDRTADAARHPQRPLPSRKIRPETVWALGWGVLIVGALPLPFLGRDCALAGLGVALLTVLYAAVARGTWGLGFLTLGAARAMNLVLGMSVEEAGVAHFAAAAIPVALYGAGWAVMRASRQPGAPPTTGFVALLHLGAALSALLFQLVAHFPYPLEAVPFLVLALALSLPRFASAVMEPRRAHVMEAIQYGFLALTLLEACEAAGSGGLLAGLVVAVLALPIYGGLRKWPVSLVTEPR
jgi:hypothetical protein